MKIKIRKAIKYSDVEKIPFSLESQYQENLGFTFYIIIN
jgi:hypothetical protein